MKAFRVVVERSERASPSAVPRIALILSGSCCDQMVMTCSFEQLKHACCGARKLTLSVSGAGVLQSGDLCPCVGSPVCGSLTLPLSVRSADLTPASNTSSVPGPRSSILTTCINECQRKPESLVVLLFALCLCMMKINFLCPLCLFVSESAAWKHIPGTALLDTVLKSRDRVFIACMLSVPQSLGDFD